MRTEILETMKKWLWLEDEMEVDLVLAVAIAAMYPGDPVWAFVVDPPGALKTELCRAFPDGKYCYTLSTLTPQSLVSGFASKKKDVDILEQLNGKLLVIKDFSTILQKPGPIRDELLGRLRDAYDGTLEAAFGSGRGRVTRRATFGILAAVTPSIDRYTKVHGLLGERFIRIRSHYNRHRSAAQAIKQTGLEPEMRKEISGVIKLALDYWALKNRTLPELSPETSTRLLALADLVSIARTPILRNYRNEIEDVPEPELATRLVKQFARMAQGLFVLGNYTYPHMVRVAEDTTPELRLRVLKALWQMEKTSLKELTTMLNLPYHILSTACEDLWVLKLLARALEGGEEGEEEDRKGRRPYIYSLTPETRKKMEVSNYANCQKES